MLQRGRRLDLLYEPLGAEHGGQLRLEELDGDFSVVLQIVREIDGRHPAFAELAFDLVPAGECGVEAFSLARHQTNMRPESLSSQTSARVKTALALRSVGDQAADTSISLIRKR